MTTYRDVSVLVPIGVDDAALTACSIAEPDTDETAWVSGDSYSVGDEVIRTSTHKVYRALTDHTGVSTAPEDDAANWREIRATNRWAAFDTEATTKSRATTSVSFTIVPDEFFNAIALYGLEGHTVHVVVKDEPSGAVVYEYGPADLQEAPLDWWDWLFGVIRARTKLVLPNIPPYIGAEVTITVEASTGVEVEVGMVCVGDLRNLLADSSRGGPLHGATAEPVDFSYINTATDGTTRIVRRRNATDMRVRVVVPREAADYMLATMQEVLATPAAWIASSASGYDGLNVFGLGSGSLSYENADHSIFSLYVKGMV